MKGKQGHNHIVLAKYFYKPTLQHLAIKETGTRTQSRGVIDAIFKQLSVLNLAGARSISFKFDPFGVNATGIRDAMHHLTSEDVRSTNPACRYKVDVVCDRSEPTIEIPLINGEKLTLRCAHLDTVDITKILNRYVTPLAPKQEENTTLPPKLKKK